MRDTQPTHLVHRACVQGASQDTDRVDSCLWSLDWLCLQSQCLHWHVVWCRGLATCGRDYTATLCDVTVVTGGWDYSEWDCVGRPKVSPYPSHCGNSLCALGVGVEGSLEGWGGVGNILERVEPCY